MQMSQATLVTPEPVPFLIYNLTFALKNERLVRKSLCLGFIFSYLFLVLGYGYVGYIKDWIGI